MKRILRNMGKAKAILAIATACCLVATSVGPFAVAAAEATADEAAAAATDAASAAAAADEAADVG